MSFQSFFKEEEHTGLLFIVAFMLGIVTYFLLPDEPPLWLGGLLVVLSIACSIFLFIREKYFFASFIFLFFVSGIFLSQLHTYFKKTILLDKEIPYALITGEVETVQKKIKSQQIVLKNVEIKGLKKEQTPQKIKMWASLKVVQDKTLPPLSFECEDNKELAKIADKRGKSKSKRINTDTCVFKRPKPADIRVGDTITGMAFQLNPPATPLVRGGYFQARSLFFENIGATGSFLQLNIVKRANNKEGFLLNIKNKVIEKVSFLKDDTKGVVLSLLLGLQSQVTTSIQTLYRILGLTHILSVSGFHVSLIAFLIYGFLRFVLTFIFLPLHGTGFVIKRVSAACALIVAFLYVLLTGAEPPAVRAFMMIFFLFFCFFIDRDVLSVRTIFIAAFLLLCYKPVLILSAGFQLSFTAVLCLSVLVQEFKEKLQKKLYDRKILLFILCLLLFNFMVTIATLPIVAYHFHKIALYGFFGNLLLSFVFSFVIMPLLICAVFLMPFGYERSMLEWVDFVLTKVHQFGENIAMLPHATIAVPSVAGWGLIFFIFGFMFVCIFKGKARFIGLVLICLAPLSYFDYQKGDILLTNNARLIAVRQSDDTLFLNESYYTNFYSSNWLLSSGMLPETYSKNTLFNYKKQNIKGLSIAFEPSSCMGADLTIESKKGNYEHCPNRIKKDDFFKHTVLEVFISNKNYKILNLSKTDENRPWGLKKQKK